MTKPDHAGPPPPLTVGAVFGTQHEPGVVQALQDENAALRAKLQALDLAQAAITSFEVVEVLSLLPNLRRFRFLN